MTTTVSIQPMDRPFGAVVTGVDINDLDDASFAVINDVFETRGLLVFPAAHPTEAAQIAFGRRLGPIEVLAPGKRAITISNMRSDGTLIPPDSERATIMRANEGWHTDSSYMALSAKASVLAAHVVPAEGGETEFADMCDAYDALDPAMQQRIARLKAYHSIVWSNAQIGYDARLGNGYGFHDRPPLRPLVKVHPVTGRKALYIGRHAYGIPGLTEAESTALLDELLAIAVRPERVYVHHWQEGDMVVWDNRRMLHRARPYPADMPRRMKHVRVSGDPKTELCAETGVLQVA
ncbi:MAG: TauD/TfdA family dioxygenase [Pseudomonadota bacterium]|nr:TauD/TfdA family dioxygenase [Pseudomonadota bacterium]